MNFVLHLKSCQYSQLGVTNVQVKKVSLTVDNDATPDKPALSHFLNGEPSAQLHTNLHSTAALMPVHEQMPRVAASELQA